MPENTSTMILEYFRKNRSATAAELSLALSMTKANIQHHLKTLLKLNEIETFPNSDRIVTRRGRPEVHYRIALMHEANNVLSLSDALLNLFQQRASASSDPTNDYALLAKLFFPDYRPSIQTVRNLNQAIQLLNGHHYLARWEAYKSGPRITFRNCPYAQLLDAHPELCKIDTVLLSHLCGVPITMESRIDLKKPGSMCIFSANTLK
jgi:predicted ArsR family transcriptional regulator